MKNMSNQSEPTEKSVTNDASVLKVQCKSFLLFCALFVLFCFCCCFFVCLFVFLRRFCFPLRSAPGGDDRVNKVPRRVRYRFVTAYHSIILHSLVSRFTFIPQKKKNTEIGMPNPNPNISNKQNRSTCGVRGLIRAACTPSALQMVYQFGANFNIKNFTRRSR